MFKNYLTLFTNRYDVTFVQDFIDDEQGITFYEFVGNDGRPMPVIDGETLIEFIDIADGHHAPFFDRDLKVYDQYRR